eukprot:TRINITY_DN5518_c0_g1_i1.p1 TRINITY_DN5518_c0_g1~~TRINITY_DN5518_c0_g1_i1.p1  ORF type:complete len:488 (+),score=56.49 TRINITY_DN5518_c0_g1_i1:105-1568(+)
MNTLPAKSSKSILKIGNYRMGRTIGQGSFGKVKVAEHEVTGHKVAVKILSRSRIRALPRMDEKIRREIQILKLFRHAHIIRLYEVIETPTDIFMIMEYVSGGELFDYIVHNGKLDESKARLFFQQIISGVDYCHQHRIVHRDLKPENLLLDEKCENVKIADFGLSNFMSDGDFLQTSCGSPNYAAPEVISGQLYAGPEVDVWSCGVILYALVCARLPFDDKNIPNLFKKIRQGLYTIPSHVSAECRDLIDSTLVVDPMKRASMQQIKSHPWFQPNLPAYLRYTPLHTALTLENLDEASLQELMMKFRVTRIQALAALLDPDDCAEAKDLRVAYDLIFDSKRLYSQRYELVDNTVNEPKAEDIVQRKVREDQAYVSNSNMLWCLGIISSLPANIIMHHVYSCLKQNGFEWKAINNVNVRCRVASAFACNASPSAAREKTLKIGIQLFKVKQGQYLLDCKRLEGETFCYFNRCALLLGQLRDVLKPATT